MFSSEYEDQIRVPETALYDCQHITNLHDEDLLERLQTGLGSSVVDAQAFLNIGTDRGSGKSSQEDSLQTVILVAMLVACVAFMCFLVALFWSWRIDKRNLRTFWVERCKTDATLPDHHHNDTSSKQGSSKQGGYPAILIYPSSAVSRASRSEDGVYLESDISEDIQFSLSQYYAGGSTRSYNNICGRLQDASSIDSVESYGYSLDGYTASLSTPVPFERGSTIDDGVTTDDCLMVETE